MDVTTAPRLDTADHQQAAYPRSPTPDSPSLKRRNSSGPEPSSKKARLNYDETPPTNGAAKAEVSNDTAEHTLQSAPEKETARRDRTRDDEKKRGKRLFGGLLGTLSQTTTSNAQRRRAEIEKKQQDKLRAQEEEREEDKKKRIEAIRSRRQAQQAQWDEQAMRIRHDNQRAMSRMLVTRSEPRLYYVPFELRAVEKDVIEKQVDDCERDIARDLESNQVEEQTEGSKLDDTDVRYEQDPSTQQKPESSGEASDPPINGTNGTSHDNGPVVDAEGSDRPEEGVPSVDGSSGHEDPNERDKADENDDVMVEAGEDSVIY